MYSGHQRNSGNNRQGNGVGNANHNHHQPGNKNRPIGNNTGGSGITHSRYSGNNSKLNTSSSGSNPSGSSSGNSSMSSNSSSNNGTNQSPTSSASGSNVKNMGHSDSDWNQYCQEWNKYLVKGRQHGRESFSHNSTHSIQHNSNTGPSDGVSANQNVGARNDIASGSEKWTGSMNQNVQGPAMPEVTGVTLKDNYQTIEGEKKINSASDCDPNAMVKPFIPYTHSNSNRYHSRGNWNNRGGRGGGKSRGFNNSNNRGGGDNRGLIQYQSHGGYYTTPMPAMPAAGLGLPVDAYGGYNFISVAAPFQFAPYLCEPDFQTCPPAQTCYSPANGLIPQYYSLPAAAFQYVPVSIGAPGGMPTAGVAPTTGPPLPTLPPLPPSDSYSCTLDIMNNITNE